jgi:hypothetical protein
MVIMKQQRKSVTTKVDDITHLTQLQLKRLTITI